MVQPVQPIGDDNAMLSPHSHKGPALIEMPNPHSLESGYGSHPGSATVMSDQTPPPPFGVVSSNHDQTSPERQMLEEMILKERRELSKLKLDSKSKHLDKLPFEKDSDHKVKATPVWSKDLENRIESLLNEQNQKYNLNKTKVEHPKSTLHAKHVDASPSSQNDNEPDPITKIKREKTPEDLEDGECSGDDAGEEQDEHLEEEDGVISNKRHEHHETPSVDANKKTILSPNVEFSDNSRQRFSRSPSPVRYPPGHSPPRPIERRAFDARPERYSPPPHDSYYHHRMRHPSPARPPAEYSDRNYHMYGARPHSPLYGLHRRRSPVYDGHHRVPRSPGYDHRHPHHHYSPPRRRPPSPGYLRHHEMRPGHPEFSRRRSPSPGSFVHHRRSPSPLRKYGGTLIRREYDYSPHRERMVYSPREMDRHHGGFSPRHHERERHRRHSPDHRNLIRSPEAPKLREHRELPPEFRDRWAHHRSPSPHHIR